MRCSTPHIPLTRTPNFCLQKNPAVGDYSSINKHEEGLREADFHDLCANHFRELKGGSLKARRRIPARWFTISFLMVISTALASGQTQPQVPAQTHLEVPAQTQPETKASTQREVTTKTKPEIKTETQKETNARTHPEIIEGATAGSRQSTQMQDSTVTKIGFAKKGAAKNKTYAGQCQATTKAGIRCTRKAVAGSKYCQLHSGTKVDPVSQLKSE
jgi:hypothetical protein